MKHQASKDIVVAAILVDEYDKVLIVKPAHKEGWIFPGGYVEIGESPSQACQREIMTEIGTAINGPQRLLSVDYHSHTSEYVMFIFDGGVLTEEKKRSIKLSPNLKDWKFVPAEEALTLLRANSARRLMPTLEARNRTGIAYLEHEIVFPYV